MTLCNSQPHSEGFVSSMVRSIECQAQLLGSAPYQALSVPGSTLSLVLTGFLTIFIALIGYNLLLGRNLSVRGATLAAVKIGIVLALASDWPAYRTLVYDLIIEGPAQLLSGVGQPAGVPGSDGNLLARLDVADKALSRLAVEGAGIGIGDGIPPPPFAGFNAFALGGSRILFLLTAIGGLAVVRILAGLMLAMGPFFIAFVMFDNTRSLFEGWVRVLAGAAVAGVGVSITLGLELALLEPWLAGVLVQRDGDADLPAVPTELLVMICVFSLVVAAVLIGCSWLTRAFRLAPLTTFFDQQLPTANAGLSDFRQAARQSVPANVERSRAAAIVDAMVSAQRREHASVELAGGSRTPLPPVWSNVRSERNSHVAVPVGRSFQRPQSRVSASANVRDLK